MNTRTITMELPGAQAGSLEEAVLESAAQLTSAIMRHLALVASGKATEMGGESHITGPDGRQYTVSLWLRNAADAPVPLGERIAKGNA